MKVPQNNLVREREETDRCHCHEDSCTNPVPHAYLQLWWKILPPVSRWAYRAEVHLLHRQTGDVVVG